MSNRKGYFIYENKKLSLTDALKEPEVSEFLQRDGPLKNGPPRNKLRRLFKVNGITRELVDQYLEEERALPRRKGAVEINGEQMTARQALNRFPLLSGYLQRKRVPSEKSLHAKFLKKFRAGKVPEYMLYEDPPQLTQSVNHFGGARMQFKMNDPRIRYRNLESLLEFIKPQVIELISATPNTKVGLSVTPWVIKRSGTNFIKQLKVLHSGSIYEKFPGTNPETIYNAMCDSWPTATYGGYGRVGWVLESIVRVIL